MAMNGVPIAADQLLHEATRIADRLLEVQTRVNAQIDETLAELLPGVQQQLGVSPAEAADSADLVNSRITGLGVAAPPAAAAPAAPLPPPPVATTRDARRAV